VLVRFWGTRGSIATPGPATIRFGGNTSCVELITKAGQRFIFDCGTGARPLGAHLMAHEPKPITATILLTHTHWDHIQGFPFFAPVFVAGNKFTVYAPRGAGRSLTEVLAGQMEYTYFPVELGQLGADIEYRDLGEGEYDIRGVRVTTHLLNHPANTLGYKIEADGVSLLYLCDHEPYWEKLWRSDGEPGKLESILHAGDLRHAAFMENADVVIHDAQYTTEEYPAKKNWGHSTYSFVVKIAAAANVKRLFLTHHDPCHDDDFLIQVEQRSREIAAALGSPIRISCAYEGCEEIFENATDPTRAGDVQVHDPIHGRSLKILVVDDDEDLRFLARRSLARGGHEVTEASGGAEAVRSIERQMPDLILLDLNMPAPDGLETLRMLRSREATRSVPVIVLTAKDDEESVAASFELGATDFLSKPFTLPQLEARVRACFAVPHARGHGRHHKK
jgi:CheY-like chemotaxis protein/phosphoribosyl 1,2-cyclic phosphodiesterase